MMDWPDPVEVLNPDGASDVVLLCEHASNFIPAEYDGLGLSPHELSRHIAWDIGAARVTRKPTLTLGGADVTSTLLSYGVVLGEDMTGTEHRVAATAGFGVLRPIGKMYIDVAYRLTYIKTDGSPTKINGIRIGVGARF